MIWRLRTRCLVLWFWLQAVIADRKYVTPRGFWEMWRISGEAAVIMHGLKRARE